MGILEVLGHFLKKFLIWDHESWFTGILWVLSGVYEKWPMWAKFSDRFFALNRAKIGQYIGFCLFSELVSTALR